MTATPPASSPTDRTKNLTDTQLRRLIYSNWDLQQALSALTFLLEECNYDSEYTSVELRRFRCFEATAIIAFSRPFEPGRNETTLGLRTLGVRLTASEESLQQRILDLRGKVIAHSDEDEMHFTGEILEPLEDLPIRIPHFQYVESLYLGEGEAHALEHLLRRLLHRIASVLDELSKSAPERLSQHKRPRSIRRR